MIIAIEIDAGVNGRLHDNPAWIRLVRVVPNLEVFSEAGRDLRESVFGRKHRREGTRTFNRMFSSCETLFGQHRREVSIACSMPRVKRFRHRAKAFAKPRS